MITNPAPLYPGNVLDEVYMAQMSLSQTDVASLFECSPGKIKEIASGKRGISPSFAIVLELVIGTAAELWVRMQAEYDLWEARSKAE